MSFERDFPIGSDSAAAGVPSRRLVKIAFGQVEFGPGAGLSSVVHVGQQIQSNDTVRFAPLIHNGSFVRVGVRVPWTQIFSELGTGTVGATAKGGRHLR